LIAGVQELIGALDDEMRFGRGNKAQLDVLLLDEIARAKSDITTSEKNSGESKNKENWGPKE